MHEKAQQKSTNVIDAAVGSRIRRQRKIREMTQTALATRLGITFQQVQKYENGTNRVGSSRLQDIANILNVPVSHFFEDGFTAPPRVPKMTADDAVLRFLVSEEGLALNRAFQRVKDPKLRRKIVSLIRALANDHSMQP